MELRKEYAGIVDAHVGGLSDIACERIELVALACQELADRPPRELTDAEIDAINGKYFPRGDERHNERLAGREIIAAFLEKQREPQVVKFRAARHKKSQQLAVLDALYGDWEWLEPAQEFEVRI